MLPGLLFVDRPVKDHNLVHEADVLEIVEVSGIRETKESNLSIGVMVTLIPSGCRTRFRDPFAPVNSMARPVRVLRLDDRDPHAPCRDRK